MDVKNFRGRFPGQLFEVVRAWYYLSRSLTIYESIRTFGKTENMGVQTGRLPALPLRSEGIFGQGHSDKLQIVNEQNIKCRCNDLSGSYLITRGKGKFQSRAEVFILFPL